MAGCRSDTAHMSAVCAIPSSAPLTSRTASQESRDHVDVTGPRCRHQRRFSSRLAKIWVGASRQQHLHHGVAGVCAREEQWRHAQLIGRVDLSTRLYQQRRGGRRIMMDRPVQRSCAIPLRGVSRPRPVRANARTAATSCSFTASMSLRSRPAAVAPATISTSRNGTSTSPFIVVCIYVAPLLFAATRPAIHLTAGRLTDVPCCPRSSPRARRAYPAASCGDSTAASHRGYRICRPPPFSCPVPPPARIIGSSLGS